MGNLKITEKSDFIWNQAKETLEKLNQKKISVEQAKAAASLLKQANNIVVFQLDAAKFITSPDRKNTNEALNDVGL